MNGLTQAGERAGDFERMIPRLSKALAASLIAAAAILGAGNAPAQQQAERVAVHTDWSVFTPANPRECYIVSPPTSSAARRNGQPVEVNRGDIRLFVTFRPGESVRNEVSFTGGYPFQAGTPVRLQVGSDTFNLNPGAGDASGWAWPASADEDERIVAALRRGSTATVTGVSSRGTTTIDTFSLMGFTAAVNDAGARCQ
jgi:invasion protein IalB